MTTEPNTDMTTGHSRRFLPSGDTPQISDRADELLDGFVIELAKVDTETLEAIAAYRDTICPGGWLQTCIREYVDVWR